MFMMYMTILNIPPPYRSKVDLMLIREAGLGGGGFQLNEYFLYFFQFEDLYLRDKTSENHSLF